jgi:hypothetical protein
VIVVYTPDEGEPQRWPFKPGRVMATEAEAIEKVTGYSFQEWGDAMEKGSATALRALVWILRKRHEDPTVRYRDVDFPLGAVEIEMEDDDPKPPAADGVTDQPGDDGEVDEPAPKDEATSSGDDSD